MGHRVAIVNGFNGFSVCLVCIRGLFGTEQSENNLPSTYVHPREPFTTYDCGNRAADESAPHAPGVTPVAQTVHEVDINYFATREQFIPVIIVYRYIVDVVAQFSTNFSPIDHYCSPLFRIR